MHHRNRCLSITLLVLLFLTTNAWSGFEDSHTSYTKGDYETAFKGYLEAAENGDPRAFGKVAALYLYGRGTQKDYSQAYIWFGVAKASKDKYAAKFQDTAASMLTRKQIDMADEILAKKLTEMGIKSE